MTGGDRGEHSAAARAADLNAAGGQAGDQCRRTANKNWIDVDAVFGKKALLLSQPERHDARRKGSVTDDILACCARPERNTRAQRMKYETD